VELINQHVSLSVSNTPSE